MTLAQISYRIGYDGSICHITVPETHDVQSTVEPPRRYSPLFAPSSPSVHPAAHFTPLPPSPHTMVRL